MIYAAQSRGLNVPNDISITGIGDFSSSESSFPSITTVRMRPNEVGKKAASVLPSASAPQISAAALGA